ncbi:hypothetical protein BJF83_14265 [Nocardiopsis sp. CNR-923]|uniref:hypothetical protein n=1 Tax=Nocardiopsis sp. CNR-923 TaxID=1904965 RepID=UPI00095F31CA|nr:hypothetical protein [Nocardiopsis sp. CNR-923]OLT28793.1 hypothetical protein BJF83_14265 [Nocardiopsis sp. CNR-923]
MDTKDRTGPSEPHATLSAYFGTPLAPREFTLPSGVRVGVDCADDTPTTVLGQCYIHWGQIKSNQRNKVIADAFKLAWLRDTGFPDARAVLALSTPFTRLLGHGAWLPAALAAHRIEVHLVDEGRNVQRMDIVP